MFKFPLFLAVAFSAATVFAQPDNTALANDPLPSDFDKPQLSLPQAIQAAGLSQHMIIEAGLEEAGQKLIYRLTSPINGEINLIEIDANDGSLLRQLALSSLHPQLNKAIEITQQNFSGQIISAYADVNEDVTQPVYMIELLTEDEITLIELNHHFKVTYSETLSEDEFSEDDFANDQFTETGSAQHFDS